MLSRLRDPAADTLDRIACALWSAAHRLRPITPPGPNSSDVLDDYHDVINERNRLSALLARTLGYLDHGTWRCGGERGCVCGLDHLETEIRSYFEAP